MNLTNKLLDKPFFYDLVELLLGMDFYKTAQNKIIKYPHQSVIDIGCGTGKILNYLKPENYLGLDINEKYLNYAKKRCQRSGVIFLTQDAAKINKIDGCYDLLLMINFIHHLSTKELRTVLQRILKNVNFSRMIVIDGQPDCGILTKLLEKTDQGNHFRNLKQITDIYKNYFDVAEAYVVKKFYWLYKYSIIVARKK